MGTYKKEVYYTIGFFILYLLMAHTAPWAILFGIDNSIRVLGFPLHYFAAVFLGWFGVLAVSIWWNLWADKLEDEIASNAESVGQPLETGAPHPAPAAASQGAANGGRP
jgi:hypothetical protein